VARRRKARPRKEYEVANVHRECAHEGCRNVIMHFAHPKGDDPRTVPVWCRVHEREAWVRWERQR
jgi:hypothetical protein